MNRHDRETFDRIQALPERTENQQRLVDNMLRWDELEAHHDNRERDWEAHDDAPSPTPPPDAGDYSGRYASNGSYAEVLARIGDVLADTSGQSAAQSAAEGWAR